VKRLDRRTRSLARPNSTTIRERRCGRAVASCGTVSLGGRPSRLARTGLDVVLLEFLRARTPRIPRRAASPRWRTALLTFFHVTRPTSPWYVPSGTTGIVSGPTPSLLCPSAPNRALVLRVHGRSQPGAWSFAVPDARAAEVRGSRRRQVSLRYRWSGATPLGRGAARDYSRPLFPRAQVSPPPRGSSFLGNLEEKAFIRRLGNSHPLPFCWLLPSRASLPAACFLCQCFGEEARSSTTPSRATQHGP